jgi:regulator of sigma E protease
MSVILLIVGLILFVGLVVIHEFGHFILAKRNGVEVEEFGIGFPPHAKTLAIKNGTKYTLNWLPLGGFVKLKGEHDTDTEKGSFGAASLWAKTKIMAAGVVMNLVAAFILLTLLAAVGIPKLFDNQYTVKNDTKIIRQDVYIGYVEPNSPAEKAGLQARDQLTSVSTEGGQAIHITDINTFPEVTKNFAGKKIELRYRRGKEARLTTVTLRDTAEVVASKSTDDPKGYLGVVPTEYVIRRSTWSSPVVAGGLIKQFTELTYKGLGSALANLFRGDTGKASEQVAGPVGIFVILRDGSLLGYQFVLMIIAIISLTLAIMNVLPIPALDGGRLFVTLISRAVRKPLKARTEEFIHGTGFALLMLLFVLITIVDVRRFF